MHRTSGGLIAGGLFVLPSLAILIALTWVYLSFGHLPQIAGILYGVKPAVVAIMVFAAYRIGARVLRNPMLWAISASAFVALALFNVPFPYIILLAAFFGFVGSRMMPEKFTIQNPQNSAGKPARKALIDDDTPTPEHAKFRLQRVVTLIIVGCSLWGMALGLLTVIYGWQAVLTQMAWFFTKVALLTFGGAYAVLPYVYQGAVQMHGWLTPLQMMDGLALGETTPGPLIMVVAFVGFVGGWTHAIFGTENPLLAGAAAASVATFFTFLPSFMFIFIGGPLVESTQGDLRFTAPLTGITTAVVGVILNLAVFFAYHVIWPRGLHNEIDWLSVLGVGIAVLALLKFKMGIIRLIVVSGFAGFILYTVR